MAYTLLGKLPYKIEFSRHKSGEPNRIVRIEQVRQGSGKWFWQTTYRDGYETPSAFLIGESKTKVGAMRLANKFMKSRAPRHHGTLMR